jgi:hypothetical protein
MRELKFNLGIDSTVLLNPNPTEFFAKAYLNQDIVDNFRTLPGIKTKTKIATTAFGSLLKASDCSFTTDTGSTFSSITIDVVAVSAMAEICRFDIEQSYLSLSMAKGSGASYEVQPFMNFYWEQMANEVAQEIELLRWQGNTAGSGATYSGVNAFKTLANGYEKKLAATTGVIPVTATTVTSSNVLAQMASVYAALATSAPQLIARTQDLRFFVSPNVAAAYRQAVAAGNTMTYVTKNLDFSFLDIKLVIGQGMSANKMVLTLRDNLIYAFDGEGDSKALKAINLEETVAEPRLRTRANIKIGFFLVNPTEIVYYS